MRVKRALRPGYYCWFAFGLHVDVLQGVRYILGVDLSIREQVTGNVEINGVCESRGREQLANVAAEVYVTCSARPRRHDDGLLRTPRKTWWNVHSSTKLGFGNREGCVAKFGVVECTEEWDSAIGARW